MYKREVRWQIWERMERENLVLFPRPCYRRIPNFKGADRAARRLAGLESFQRVRCIFSAPDSSLREARALALKEGKILAVVLPHMKGYLQIEERRRVDIAVTLRGFRRFGVPLREPIDLFMQGSVAVDPLGNRLGKGKGYGDREHEELIARGMMSPLAVTVTLVHDCQVVEDLSSVVDEHDVRMDLVVTPTRIIDTRRNTQL